MIFERPWGQSFVLVLLMAVTAMPCNAVAARPKLVSTVSSGLVRLSDLFSGLEPGQDCEIGPGPGPGGRIVIDQPQLAAIAEEFGVEWQPGYITARVIIERKGRLVGRDELLAIFGKALRKAGAAEDMEVSVTGSANLVVSTEFTGPPEVESMNYDRASGRFSADLLFQARGVDPVRVPFEGFALEMVTIPATTRALNVGTILSPADLELERVRKSATNERTLLTVQDGVGLAVKHMLRSGVPVSIDDLGPANLVFHGMPILLRLESPGLVLTTRGEAIDPGALGEHIHVLNPSSRTIVIARVTGPGAAQVDAASTPGAVVSRQMELPTAFSLSSYPAPATQSGPLP